MFRFAREYLLAIFKFRRLGCCVTVFGSARMTADDRYYQWAMDVGRLLAEKGVPVMTGGGPGIMEAANRGAYEAQGQSCGCAINIPFENKSNDFMRLSCCFNYFFMRKMMLTRFSFAFIALPGGLGTLDEIFELLTLIKTQRIKAFPVVLIGKDFWQPLMDYLNSLVEQKMIKPQEIETLVLTDDPNEAIESITDAIEASAR